jgi:hypothetical protein
LSNRVTRLVVHLAPAIGQIARRVAGTAILLRRAVRQVARLLRNLIAEVRASLRREQHAESRAEHGAGEQAHHEAPASTFVLESIVSISHDAPLVTMANGPTGHQPSAIYHQPSATAIHQPSTYPIHQPFT